MVARSDSNTANVIDYSRLRVLVVDDFENFRLSMRQMLRSMGVGHIDACSDGPAAVQACTYEAFDFVLCDYNLGTGKNGQHVLEELRHRKLLRRTSLFIMVTAETSREMVMGAREYQPDGYLTKPINQAALSQRLGALLQQRAALQPINREIDLENYPKAISLCTRLLPEQPRYRTWILKTLSDLYYQVGDYAHARRIYEDVLQSRDIAWAQLGLGRILIAEQRYPEAIDTLQSLLEKQPDLIEAYDQLAQALKLGGKPGAAQKVLARAAELSPNAILRQQQLARLAAQNQDPENASTAWRRTVELGAHSIHDHPDHYLGLARSLSDLAEDDDSDSGRSRANEAIKTLKLIAKRFPDADEAQATGRWIEARVHWGQNRQAEADAIISEVVGTEVSGSVDCELELARTLFTLDRKQEAKARLYALSRRYEGDAQVQAEIEALLDEPVSFRKRLKARRLTRQGIRAFEAGQLRKAAEAFREALELVPDHIALNLNLIQVHLKAMNQTPDTAAVAECRRCLERIEDLPEPHPQQRRFQALKSKVESLT